MGVTTARPSASLPTSVYAQIGAWLVAGALATWLLWQAAAPASRPPLTVLVALAAFTALAEVTRVPIRIGGEENAYTPMEAALVASLIIVGSWWTLVVMLTGLSFAQGALRRSAEKVAFNTGQIAVATVTAALVFDTLGGPGGGPTDLATVAAALAATIAYTVVTASAVNVLLSRINGQSPWRLMIQRRRLIGSALAVGGGGGVGLLVAALVEPGNGAIWLLVVPLVLVHISVRALASRDAELDAKQAEAARLSRIVDGTSDGIVLTDGCGNVIVWSPSMETMTGVSPESASRQAVGTLLPMTAGMPDADSDATTAVARGTIVHPGGGTREVEVHRTQLFDHEGSLTGTVIICHDLTRQHAAEQLKHDFLARVSHELRSPLTPILTYGEALRDFDDLPEAFIRSGAEMVVERSQHLTRLIDDLLLVSKVTSGGARWTDQVRPVPTDLAALCERTAQTVRANYPDYRVVVTAGEIGTAHVDPTRAEQVLTNLLTNACRYSPVGSTVSVTVREGAGLLHVDVADHGFGIPTEHLDAIFDKFHRVEKPMTMETSGAGLGLYLARQLVEAMGGTIAVVSSVGRGSVFTATFPVATDIIAVPDDADTELAAAG